MDPLWPKYSNVLIYRQLSAPDFLAFDLIFSPSTPIVKPRLKRKNTWRVEMDWKTMLAYVGYVWDTRDFSV